MLRKKIYFISLALTYSIILHVTTLFSQNKATSLLSHDKITQGIDKREFDNQLDRMGMPATPTIIRTVVEGQAIFTADNWTTDTIYYSDLVKEGLWYKGSGKPISKKTANNLDQAYRMTMRINNGRYLHVESLKKGQLSPSHIFQSYLLPIDRYDYDPAFFNDSVWLTNQQRIAQVYLTPSLDGSSIISERCYDNDQSIIHTMSIERIEPFKAIATYHNPDGLLINLTNSTHYDAGTIVIIEWEDTITLPKTIVADRSGWPIKTI